MCCPTLWNFFVYFLDVLGFVGHSFAYVAYIVFLRDVWIPVASRRATNLATYRYLPNLTTHLRYGYIMKHLK